MLAEQCGAEVCQEWGCAGDCKCELLLVGNYAPAQHTLPEAEGLLCWTCIWLVLAAVDEADAEEVDEFADLVSGMDFCKIRDLAAIIASAIVLAFN